MAEISRLASPDDEPAKQRDLREQGREMRMPVDEDGAGFVLVAAAECFFERAVQQRANRQSEWERENAHCFSREAPGRAQAIRYVVIVICRDVNRQNDEKSDDRERCVSKPNSSRRAPSGGLRSVVRHPLLGRMRMMTSQPTISIPSGGAGRRANSTEPSAASNMRPVASSMK